MLKYLLAAFVVMQNFAIAAQNLSSLDSLQAKIEYQNSNFSNALLNNQIDTIINYYLPHAIVMPEFSKVLLNRTEISHYYTAWLDSTTVNHHKKTIFKIVRDGNFVFETGHIEHNFKLNNTGKNYRCKYIQVWNISNDSTLKIISQIWGAVTWIDRNELPAIKITTTPDNYSFNGNQKAFGQIQRYNNEIAGLVKARNGAGFSDYYSPDAIYMPYYSDMIIGKDSIHQYYLRHEDPVVKIDSVAIKIRRLTHAGQYYLAENFYGVNFVYSGNAGHVDGKSINIWRREPDGKLRLLWQMTNHD